MSVVISWNITRCHPEHVIAKILQNPKK